MNRKFNSLTIRLAVIVLTILIFSTACIGVISYLLNRSQAIDSYADKAQALSEAVASVVDPVQFRKILDTGEKNEYWYAFKASINEILEKDNLLYLYMVDSKYDTDVTYFAEGYPASSREASEIDLGDKQSVDFYAPELYAAIESGKGQMTDIYYLDGFGNMVSGFAPILDESGRVIGAVGIDLSVDDVVASSNQFGLTIIAIVAGLCVIVGFIIVWYIKKSIGTPIVDLTKAAEKISMGDTDITVYSKKNDEIGALVDSFAKMIANTKVQARLIESLADGDLTMRIAPRCEKDIINVAIAKMVNNLNQMFWQINNSSTQLSSGSKQIADGAQMLAQGATEQASAIEELTESMERVSKETKNNAEMAERAAAPGRAD